MRWEKGFETLASENGLVRVIVSLHNRWKQGIQVPNQWHWQSRIKLPINAFVSKHIGVSELDWLLNVTFNNISVIYVMAHRCGRTEEEVGQNCCWGLTVCVSSVLQKSRSYTWKVTNIICKPSTCSHVQFLCRLRSIATHRDHFVRPSVTLAELCFAGDTCIPRNAATIFRLAKWKFSCYYFFTFSAVAYFCACKNKHNKQIWLLWLSVKISFIILPVLFLR